MDSPKYSEEHISQIPALVMLMKMGFKYITPEQALEMRGGRTSSVLLEGVLKKWLYDHNDIHYKGRLYKFDESNISTAVAALRDLPIQEGYRKVNQLFYDIITLGKSFEQTLLGDKKAFSMHFLDWQHPENNVFHVTDEYSVTRSGRNDTYRPDLVLFVNGIPMVIMECKKPSLQGNTPPVERAIEQHIDYQHEAGIRGLYYYSNVLLALAVDQNSYGTTATKKEFWGIWREMLGSSEEQSRYDTALTTLKNKQLSQNEQTTLFQDRYRSVLLHFKNLEKENPPGLLQSARA